MTAMTSDSIELQPLSGTPVEAAMVQRIYDDTPGYDMMMTGEIGRPGGAMRTFDMLPDGCTRQQKHTFLITRDDRPVGFTDVIRGYPDTGTAYIGLFIIVESCQGTGTGGRAYRALESLIAGWPGIGRIELSVVAINSPALGFWAAMGFAPTGECTPYESGTVRSEHLFFAKRLDSNG